MLLTFLATVAAIIVTPGADMAVILGSTLQAGRRQGYAALAGVLSGALVHVGVAALGLSALIAASPGLLRIIALAGSVYLVWIGVSLARSGAELALGLKGPAGGWAAWRRAVVTNLLNPKAYLFMLAIFPQFLKPGGWPNWAQTLVLGAILVASAGLLYGLMVAVSAAVAGRGGVRPGATLWIGRLTGIYLAGLGLVMAAVSLLRA
ncbi:MAG TPA: LysE family translocator [Phenylobacterium sp.]|nr:LysE family translocator [Phenylobacterium sp.]